MPAKVALAFVLLVGLAFTEGIGLLLIIPLLELVGIGTQGGVTSEISSRVLSLFVFFGIPVTLTAVLSVYVVIMIVFTLLTRWQSVTIYAITYEFESTLRQRLYTAVVNTNWLFFSRSRASTFTHALTAEVERVGSGTFTFLQMLADGAILIVYLIIAWQLSAVLTGAVVICGVVMLIVLSKMVHTSKVKGTAISVDTRELYGSVTEHLDGMKTVKSYGAQDQNVALFSTLNKRVAQHYLASMRNWINTGALFQIGSVLILSGSLVVMINFLYLPAASVLLLLLLFFRIIPRLSSIRGSYQSVINMIPSFANIAALQASCEREAEREVDDPAEITLKQSVDLRHVDFAYSDDARLAVKDISMTIHVGETTAVVGSSGAGKSTIADLIMGLVVANKGQVLIDGVPLNPKRIYAWRNRIGYVAQDTFLFNDTVRANLLWAYPEASDLELDEALRLAAADDFVRKLPDGMETLLGDRGVRLSGGERQRLALARALLRKPNVLILDEATSNLDSENERRIQDAIDVLRGDITILIITHRLSTIRNADSIYVIEGGRLVESGDWATLTGREGRFVELCRAQNVA